MQADQVATANIPAFEPGVLLAVTLVEQPIMTMSLPPQIRETASWRFALPKCKNKEVRTCPTLFSFMGVL